MKWSSRSRTMTDLVRKQGGKTKQGGTKIRLVPKSGWYQEQVGSEARGTQGGRILGEPGVGTPRASPPVALVQSKSPL